MTLIARAGAVSHVGRVRSNNQDSGYVGRHLFAVADGMGGHAGGDVASATAAQYFQQLDGEFGDYVTTGEAEEALKDMLVEANRLIVAQVAERPELRGLGTTASVIAFVDEQIVIGHIGDSRIYRLHNGVMTQETNDHTFVQKLVDAGRITPEEALVHPRRSVLMKVLGDVETKPDADAMTREAVPGDRWLICSDGLSSYVDEADIQDALGQAHESSREVADDLVQLALDNGAPDNVTVVVLEVGDEPLEPMPTRLVGSAANDDHSPSLSPRRGGARQRPKPKLKAVLDPLRRAPTPRPELEEFVPPTDEYLEQLIRMDRRRKRIRIISWLATICILIGAVVGASLVAVNWTQTQYYVGVSTDSSGAAANLSTPHVAIYQGVQQPLGPIKLNHVVEETDIPTSKLPEFQKSQVEQTINVSSLEEAHQVVERIRKSAS